MYYDRVLSEGNEELLTEGSNGQSTVKTNTVRTGAKCDINKGDQLRHNTTSIVKNICTKIQICQE